MSPGNYPEVSETWWFFISSSAFCRASNPISISQPCRRHQSRRTHHSHRNHRSLPHTRSHHHTLHNHRHNHSHRHSRHHIPRHNHRHNHPHIHHIRRSRRHSRHIHHSRPAKAEKHGSAVVVMTLCNLKLDTCPENSVKIYYILTLCQDREGEMLHTLDWLNTGSITQTLTWVYTNNLRAKKNVPSQVLVCLLERSEKDFHAHADHFVSSQICVLM